MLANYLPTGAEYFRFLPEIILTTVATIIMMLEPILGARNRSLLPNLSLAGLFAALWAAVVAYSNPGPAFQNMLLIDGFATFFRVLVIIVGILVVFCSGQYLRREKA